MVRQYERLKPGVEEKRLSGVEEKRLSGIRFGEIMFDVGYGHKICTHVTARAGRRYWGTIVLSREENGTELTI